MSWSGVRVPPKTLGDLFSICFIFLPMEITYRLSYSCRDESTRDTILDLDVSFQNPNDEILQKQLNTWLTAIGKNLEVVVKS